MPELPEIEATVRLIDRAARGATVESARAPGLATMRTFSPSLDALTGATLTGLGRRGKLLLVRFDGGGLPGPSTLVLHLMSAGRLQLYDKLAGPRDRTSRILVRLRGGGDAEADAGEPPLRELRLREFGTKQAAWGKLLPDDELAQDETLATLGPEAWPDPPDLTGLPPRRTLRGAIRDQRVLAGIGRTWADEILWHARLAPLRRCGDLDDEERARLRAAMTEVLGGTLDLYLHGGPDPTRPDGKPRAPLALPLPDKLPLPLLVHRRTGEPCPRCGTALLAVHYEDDEMTYCPTCQTGGKPYKDRRLSRLLKD